jgi:large subunit ribosomal protein L4
MKLPVYTTAGAETGRSVELDEAVFGVEPNDHVIWLDVRSIQAAARQGTHKTKERAEVSYSTKKLFRQKGTGGARRGSRKSPLLRKGGTIFGPRPHEYNVRVNRKTKQLARRSAIAYKLRDEALRIVEDLQFEAPRTRDMAQIVKDNGLATSKVLLLTAAHNEAVHRSGRNLPKVSVLPAATASTLDLLGAQTILLTEGAVEVLTEALRPAEKPTAVDVVETGTPVEAAPEKPARARKPKAQAKPAAEVAAEPTTDVAEPDVAVADDAPVGEVPADVAPDVAAMDQPVAPDEAADTETNEQAA